MKTKSPILTLRQFEVLCSLRECGCQRSESDGSILRALAKKGVVNQHHNNNGCGGIFYTWTVRPDFRDAVFTIK